MSPKDHRNKKNLRIVETVDCWYSLNKAIEAGNVTLFRKIKRNPKLYSTNLMLRHYQSGLFREVRSRRFHTRRGLLEFPESEWECVHSYERYHRVHRAGKAWAAYVLPLQPVVGERFYIGDIIEDVLVQVFWGRPIPAKDGEAIWNGEDLELDESIFKQHYIMG